jgi:hypothetical protein
MKFKSAAINKESLQALILHPAGPAARSAPSHKDGLPFYVWVPLRSAAPKLARMQTQFASEGFLAIRHRRISPASRHP